jgi:hypothetical protein
MEDALSPAWHRFTSTRRSGSESRRRGVPPSHQAPKTFSQGSKFMSSHEMDTILRIQYTATHPPDSTPYHNDYYCVAVRVKQTDSHPTALAAHQFWPSALREMLPQERTGATHHTPGRALRRSSHAPMYAPQSYAVARGCTHQRLQEVFSSLVEALCEGSSLKGEEPAPGSLNSAFLERGAGCTAPRCHRRCTAAH